MSAGVIAASSVLGPIIPGDALFFDSFSRSAAVIGNTEYPGTPWNLLSGSFQTDGDNLGATVSVESRASLNIGAPPKKIKIVTGVSGAFGVFFRWNQGSEGWYFNTINQILYTVNGGFFAKSSDLGLPANGTSFEIDVYASGQTRVRRNGTQIIDYSESWQLSNVYAGLRFEGIGVPKLTEFGVYPLP